MLGSIPKIKNRQTFSSSCIAEAMWNLALNSVFTDTLTERPEALNNTHSTKEIGGWDKGQQVVNAVKSYVHSALQSTPHWAHVESL